MNNDKLRKCEEERMKHLKNKKHERYFPVPAWDGFLIIDRQSEEYGYGEKGYNLRCGPCGEQVEDDEYKTVDEFMDLLNSLDLKVNGNLDDMDMVLFSKPKLYELIESRLDSLLEQDLIYPETFEVAIRTGDTLYDTYTLHFKGTLYKSGDEHLLLDNPQFMLFMQIINNRLDELEKEPDSQEKHIRVDELINLKTLLFQGGVI